MANQRVLDQTASVNKAEYIRSLFDRIAGRYDLLNSVMSLNLHQRWRRAAVKAAALKPGQKVLDVATGTGDLAFLLSTKVGPKGQVIGLDFSPNMLGIALAKAGRHNSSASCRFEQGDALNIPFADGFFDCATIAFALRNVANIHRCLYEMHRVVRPGGRLISLDLFIPTNPVLRHLFLQYSYSVIPALGWLLQGVRWPYAYLPRSVASFCSPQELALLMTSSGWRNVRYQTLSAGIVSLHVGEA